MIDKIRWKESAQEQLQVHVDHEVVWLSFAALDEQPGLVNGFSTRMGGVSEGYLSTMNLSFSRGDDPDRVLENYRRISKAMGFSAEDIVCSDQTHTTNVRVAKGCHRGMGVVRPKQWTDVDGLITNEPDVALCTSFADCVPIYLYDPVHRAIGLSHSGWKGTVGEISRVTLMAMNREYGTMPQDVIACIGPSICQDCYEVSEDVIGQIRKVYPEALWKLLFYRKENGHYQLNLWECCRQTLLAAGLPDKNIHLPNLCTCCNPKLLFSHRASKGQRGNLNAFLMLRT